MILILLPQKRNPQWVRDKLKSHMLFQDDQAAWNQFPKFQEHVRCILNQNRVSEVGPVEAAEFEEILSMYSSDNEDTFLLHILPFLIKPSRTVVTTQSQSGNNTTEGYAEESSVVAWHRSGLKTIANREYKRTFLSFRDGQDADEALVIEMQKEDHVTNPKPDRIFSVGADAASLPKGFRISEEIAQYLEIVSGLHNPHAILEGKSTDGNIEDARNQACRGGAALVLAGRLLRGLLGMPDSTGPDTRTMVFSATLDPNVVEIWVHWALVPEEGGKLEFHMNRLAQKGLLENLGPIRRLMHNILDWGCGTRQEGLNSLYEKIETYETEAAAQSPAKKKAKTK